MLAINYAMYDAAHAPLLALKKADYKVTKTHSRLIAAFGLHIVSPGKICRELGRSLNEVEQLRLLAPSYLNGWFVEGKSIILARKQVQ